VAERVARNAVGRRTPFFVSVPTDPGQYARETLMVRVGGASGRVTEITLGRTR